MEKADSGGSDAAGASGDEGYFVLEGECDTRHGTSVSIGEESLFENGLRASEKCRAREGSIYFTGC